MDRLVYTHLDFIQQEIPFFFLIKSCHFGRVKKIILLFALQLSLLLYLVKYSLRKKTNYHNGDILIFDENPIKNTENL